MWPRLSLHTWTCIGLGITALYLVGAVVLVALRRNRVPTSRRFSVIELLLCGAILAMAAYLRFGHVRTLHGGFLSMDEAAVTRTQVSSIVHFEPTVNGATYMTHAWLLDTWYGLFGISTYSARYYTAVVSAIGLVFFFAFLRLLLGARIAAWATAFLGIATYAIYFSVFALETVGLLVFVPLNAFLLVVWLRRPSVVRSCVLGLGIGLSFFTYPGVLVGYASIVAGWGLCWLLEAVTTPGWRPSTWPVDRVPWRARLLFVAAAVACIELGIVLHRRYYAQSLALFAGGGSFTITWAAYKTAIPVLAGDIFVQTDTWNLLFRGTPFVDWTFWPFALLGAYLLWTRYPSWICRGALLSPIIDVLVIPFCGFYPGMRRGLYILFPISACVGIGVDALFAWLGAPVAALLVLVAAAHPIYFQQTFGRTQWRSTNFGQDWGTTPVPDDVLLDVLERQNVVMSSSEFAHPLDRLRHVALWKLAVRHGVLHGEHTLTFVDDDDRTIGNIAGRPDTVLLTWKPESVLARLAMRSGLCFPLADIERRDPRRPAVVHLADAAHVARDDVCPWAGGPARNLTSCVRLGAAHPLSKLVHGVVCSTVGCDPFRREFVFVQPGSLSFRLRPPAGAAAVQLVLKVMNTIADRRENRIWVNDHDIGLVDETGLGTDGRLRVPIPPVARAGAEVWTLKLGPGDHKDRIGWDVSWAALVDEAATPDVGKDECPARLCLHEGGRETTCEDGQAPRRPS